MYLKQSTDTAKFFEAAYRMFGVLEGLDSVDAQPNENGRVQLKYRRKNAEYLDAYRKNLYTGGSFFLNKQNYQRAFTLFRLTSTAPSNHSFRVTTTPQRTSVCLQQHSTPSIVAIAPTTLSPLCAIKTWQRLTPHAYSSPYST